MTDKFLVKRPYITEKSGLATADGKYTFLVGKDANKSEVKKIVEKEYKVTVTAVHVMNVRPKARRSTAASTPSRFPTFCDNPCNNSVSIFIPRVSIEMSTGTTGISISSKSFHKLFSLSSPTYFSYARHV